jgi:hypothetical protein
MDNANIKTASHYLVREFTATGCEVYAVGSEQEAYELRDCCAKDEGTVAQAFVVFMDDTEMFI